MLNIDKAEFQSILEEYKYSQKFIDALWNSRPSDQYITAAGIRAVAESFKSSGVSMPTDNRIGDDDVT